MSDQQLIADLHSAFPGIWAKPAAEYGRPEYQQGVWVGGEATIGDLPILADLECNDSDEYNGRVLHGFEAWLEARGYSLECYDSGVYFALAVQPELQDMPVGKAD